VITTRILLVDDHPMLRQGIRQLLERERDFEVVAEASDGEEAVTLAGELLPDVVVMDVGMPKLGGLDATKQIKAEHPRIAVLVLTIHDEDEYIIGILEAGAAGYLLKAAYGEELVQAIRAVRAGEFALHPVVAQRLLKRAAGHRLKPIKLEGVEQLTTREMEVLKLMAKGMSNQDIATELGIGVRTVKGHLVSIFAKMRVSSRTEAVLHALKQGWIAMEDIL
jgi:NarL family two-component system response regulator LiaR